MKTGVYRNTDTNVPPVNNISTTEAHPLQLFPEDRIIIHETFLRHLAQCNLTPRRLRIVLAVFNQTLGFNKLEDDMNGSRLQQLTGIAPNHANQTVRELAQLNVLVTRRGQYGNYLAINFDLAQWGQQDQPLTPNIDPCFLLPEEQNNDAGIDLSIAIDTEDEDSAETEALNDSIDVPIHVHTETPVKQTDEQNAFNTQALKPLLDAIQTLTDRITQLEKKTEQLHNDQQALQKKPQEIPQTKPQEKTQNTPTPSKASTPKPPVTQQTPAVNALRYPSTFSAPQCQQATTIIQRINDADNAQLLLDMLTKRLAQQHDPLRNPMRYLETLVEKCNNNQLTITSAHQPSQPSATFVSTTTSINGTPTPIPSKEELIRAELQEATLDCQQMERNIKMLAEQKKISFEDSLVRLHLKPLWEEAKERFAKAKEAFVSLAHEQQVVAT